MAARPRDERGSRLRVVLWNANGRPTSKVLFRKMISDPTNRNTIVILNDIRLQEGEEEIVKASCNYPAS